MEGTIALPGGLVRVMLLNREASSHKPYEIGFKNRIWFQVPAVLLTTACVGATGSVSHPMLFDLFFN